MVAPTDRGKASLPKMEAVHGQKTVSEPICARRKEMVHPVPAKGFQQLSPEAAMLSWPSVETRLPPSVLPFLMAQNLSSKDIIGSDITS